MKILFKLVTAIMLILCVNFSSFSEDKNPPTPQVVKMENVKQTLIGLEKEYNAGELIKIKISPLPSSANLITAIYKFTLLENGKASQNCVVLTKMERNNEPRKNDSDFILTAKCGGGIKYQIIFAVTYIETKVGTVEITDTYSPDISIYDVKISGVQPPGPDPGPDVPPGNYGMIRAVFLECQKIQMDKTDKIKLFTAMSNAFSGMSSKVAAGIYKDSDNDADQADNINKFLTESKELNNKAFKDLNIDKTKFDGNIDVVVENKMKELFASGKLRKFSEYQALYAEISQGFGLAAKGLQ